MKLGLPAWALGVCLASLSLSVLACSDVPLIEPAGNRVISPTDATLRWTAPAPASRYRVQVRLSHPEGPTLRTIDIQTTETELRLHPLPEGAAISVQALVGVECSSRSMDDLLATRPLFTVRQQPACRLGAPQPRWQSTRLSWAPLPQAQTYKVRVVRAPSPAINQTLDSGNLPPTLQDLLAPQEPAGASIDLGELIKLPQNLRDAVLLIQPVCQGQPGVPSAVRIPPI